MYRYAESTGTYLGTDRTSVRHYKLHADCPIACKRLVVTLEPINCVYVSDDKTSQEGREM
jgi:hypothetical protein